MRQAAKFSHLFANWQVDNPWTLDVAAARASNFFDHSYWGASLLNCVLDWVAAFEWPPQDSDQAHVDAGVAWMELVLGFMHYSQAYLPLHRPGKDGHVFAWAQNATDALAYGYSWNEAATQFATMFGQLKPLCGTDILPPHVRRARICALYRQGAGTCVFGLSLRPSFPCQSQVATIVRETFQSRIRPCAYNWWPNVVFDSPLAQGSFSWSPPDASSNVLQKKLKAGNCHARKARAP